MNQLKKLNKISNLSYFNTTTLKLIYPELSQNSLYANIKRWIKKGELIQIKKGMYVTKEYLDNTRDISSYKEFLANRIKYPSYLSLEYILQKYSILSESVYAYTSVTLKKKKEYENDFGRYIYRSITPDLFLGFTIKEVGEYTIKEATKAKALFDYLYLKLYRIKNINEQTLLELRLNMDEFTQQDLKEFNKYCKLTGQKKYKNLMYLITKTYDL
jgi:predicted transcriptional regulator of viral defense system